MTGVEYVRQLCLANKIAISQLEKECGFSNGYLNPKKQSKIPYDRALKIQGFMNTAGIEVDLSHILGIENAQAAPAPSEPQLTARDERDITDAEYTHIKKYRTLDERGKDIVDTILDKEADRIQQLHKPHLIPKAAHERTDIEVTDEMRKHDDDMMEKLFKQHNKD